MSDVDSSVLQVMRVIEQLGEGMSLDQYADFLVGVREEVSTLAEGAKDDLGRREADEG